MFCLYFIFICPELNILSTNLANKPPLLEKYGKCVEMEMCVSLTKNKEESSSKSKNAAKYLGADLNMVGIHHRKHQYFI